MFKFHWNLFSIKVYKITFFYYNKKIFNKFQFHPCPSKKKHQKKIDSNFKEKTIMAYANTQENFSSSKNL